MWNQNSSLRQFSDDQRSSRKQEPICNDRGWQNYGSMQHARQMPYDETDLSRPLYWSPGESGPSGHVFTHTASESHQSFQASHEPSRQGQEGLASSGQMSYSYDSRNLASRSFASGNTREERSSANFPETCSGASSGYPDNQRRARDEELFDESESPHGNKYRRISCAESNEQCQSPAPQSCTSNALYVRRPRPTNVNPPARPTNKPVAFNSPPIINSYSHQPTSIAGEPHTAPYVAQPYRPTVGASYSCEGFYGGQSSSSLSQEAEAEEVSQQSNHSLDFWRPCKEPQSGGILFDEEFDLHATGASSSRKPMQEKKRDRKTRKREEKLQRKLGRQIEAEEACAAGGNPNADPNRPRILTHRTPQLVQSLMRYAETSRLGKLKNILSSKQVTNANIRDEFGWTAVMFAAKDGHTPALDILKQFGADVSLTELHGNQLTALEIAVANSRITFVEYLTKLPRDVLTVLLKEPRAIALRKDKWKPDAVLPPWSKSARQHFGNLIGPAREGEDEAKFDLPAIAEQEDPEINWDEAEEKQAKKLERVQVRGAKKERRLARKKEKNMHWKQERIAQNNPYAWMA